LVFIGTKKQNQTTRKIMTEKVIIHPAGNIVENIRKCLEAVEFHPKYREVVLKPNAVDNLKSGSGHVTDLRLVDALIKVLRDVYGTTRIFIIEGSSVYLHDSLSILKGLGYEQITQKHPNVELVDVYQTPLEEGTDGLRLPSLLKGRTLINLPVLKGHGQAGLTCAVKNLKGLLQKVDKKRFHQTGLHENLVTLPEIPTELTLVDAITCQSCEGDTFSKKAKLNLLICARNPVAADIVCAQLVGFDINAIPYLKNLANQKQLLNPGALEVIGDDRQRVNWTLSYMTKLSYGKIDVYVGEACSGCIMGLLSAMATSRHKNHLKRGAVLNVLRSLFKRKRTAYIIGKNAPHLTRPYGSINLLGECACKQFPDVNGTPYRGCPPSNEDIWREQENRRITVRISVK
jgi:uncharacterized protein (DUF362 family)